MTSHDYAKKLAAVADRLLAAEEFNMPSYTEMSIADYGVKRLDYYSDKQGFLSAVKALGSGVKGGDGKTLQFIVAAGDLRLGVNRSEVCRIVKPAQPAEYDCEPLLTQMEEASLGQQ